MPWLTRLSVFAALACAAPALAQNLAPGVGAGNVLSAQLGIQGPPANLCPSEATATVWVYTDFLGTVTIMIARRGQAVGAPVQAQTVPAANGQYLATYSRKIQIIGPIDAEYRALIGGGAGITSDWVRLHTDC